MFNFMHRIAGGRLLAAIAALAITLGGIYAFRALPVDAFPDVTKHALGFQFWIIRGQYLF